jgi:hypothetical protein
METVEIVQVAGGESSQAASITLREIATALGKFIASNYKESNLHWVGVVGELPYEKKEDQRIWDNDNDMLVIGVSEGLNEGYRIFVMADKFRDECVMKPLLQIKLLGGEESAFDEAKYVKKFFSSPEFYRVLGQL